MTSACATAVSVQSCHLERIATALESGPGLVEIMATIVVPSLLGIATLVVATLSWRLAQRVHAFEVDAREQNELREKRERRWQFGQLLMSYSSAVVTEWAAAGKVRVINGVRQTDPESHTARARVEAELLRDPGPYARQISDRIRGSFRDVVADRHRGDRSKLAALTTFSNNLAIQSWVRDPTRWALDDEISEQSRLEMLQSLRERGYLDKE